MGFRLVYVFVVMEVGTRRIVHWNATQHPPADWTVQQVRAVITGEAAHRFLVHDREFKALTIPAALLATLTFASAPAWAGQRHRDANSSGQERGRAVERSQGQRSESPRAETPRSEPRQGAPAQGNEPRRDAGSQRGEPRRDVAIPRDEPRRDSIAPRYEQRNAPRYEPRYAPRYDSKYGSRYDSRSYGSRGGYGNGGGYGYPFIGDEGRIRPGTDRLSKQLRNSL